MNGQLHTFDELHRASERVSQLADELATTLTTFRTGQSLAPGSAIAPSAVSPKAVPVSPRLASIIDVVPAAGSAASRKDEAGTKASGTSAASLEDRF